MVLVPLFVVFCQYIVPLVPPVAVRSVDEQAGVVPATVTAVGMALTVNNPETLLVTAEQGLTPETIHR